jgi:hypothetical protein
VKVSFTTYETGCPRLARTTDLQLDFQNAFNSISREHLLEAVARVCPLFYPYAAACYQNPATLYASGYTVASEEGQHQGCPCGPLFFAVAIKGVTEVANSLPDCWTKWYLDDGYIGGPLVSLNDLLPRIEIPSDFV